jgi:hypothetical protein
MNRRERKAMEKKLGIANYKKTLFLNQRFEMIRQNIIEGKKMQNKLKEDIRVKDNIKADTEINQKVADRALELMMKEDMDYYSATEAAKKEYGQSV